MVCRKLIRRRRPISPTRPPTRESSNFLEQLRQQAGAAGAEEMRRAISRVRAACRPGAGCQHWRRRSTELPDETHQSAMSAASGGDWLIRTEVGLHRDAETLIIFWILFLQVAPDGSDFACAAAATRPASGGISPLR